MSQSSDVLYFQVGAWKPIVNRLSVSDDEEIYKVFGFRDSLDFARRAKKFGEGVWYAECNGLVLIEGYLHETWIRDNGDYERTLTFFRVVVTKELFEKVERNPVRAIRVAKEML